jgi:4-amino-4-deoxy-L-arabinose transferase-like glycosyltransferase
VTGSRALLGGALAALLALPCLLLGLGGAPFDDPGEGMHAQIARELQASGDLLDLRLNGVPYVDKPPLLYALLAAAFTLGGPSEAVARTVPALAALLAVGATGWLGARLLGSAGGVLAGGALLTCVGFFAYGRYVRPETLFVATLATGFGCTLVGLTEGRRGLVSAGLAAFGLASLAKDPLGAIAPLLVIGLALVLTGQARLARRLAWPGVLAWLVLTFGWWTARALQVPGFGWYTVVDNHLLNVARARHFPDEDVPLLATQFLLVAILGAAPWSLAAGLTVIDLARRRAWRQPEELPWLVLALWVVAVLGVTALSSFRLPYYGLPAYPAIALLAARAWHARRGRRLVVAHVLGFAGLALAVAAAWHGGALQFSGQVMSVTDVATRKAEIAGDPAALLPWEAMQRVLGVGVVVLTTGALLVALVAWRPGSGLRPAAAVLVTMLGLLPCVAGALAAVSSHRAVRGMAIQVGRAAAPEDVVAHEGPLENSGALEWYSRRRPVIVNGQRSVLAFGSRLDGAGVFWDAARLQAAWSSDRRVWLVSTRPPAHSVSGELPGARLVAEAGGRRLYVNR